MELQFRTPEIQQLTMRTQYSVRIILQRVLEYYNASNCRDDAWLVGRNWTKDCAPQTGRRIPDRERRTEYSKLALLRAENFIICAYDGEPLTKPIDQNEINDAISNGK